MIQARLESIPNFHNSQINQEQVIRNRNVPIEETAIIQKTSARQISFGHRNQSRFHLLILICLLVSAAEIWKCQNFMFAQVWYTLEQYRKYICRISVRRGPPMCNV